VKCFDCNLTSNKFYVNLIITEGQKMKKNFYTVKDGKIDRIQQGKAPAGNAEWHEAPLNWGGAHGAKLEWFDENMKRIPDVELVKRGIRIDNTGLVFNINDQSSRIIYGLDEELQVYETKKPPIENEPYQKFSKQENKWVVDEEAKVLAEEQAAVAQIQMQIAETEKEMLPLVIKQNRGRATSEDLRKLDELDNLIELNLKPSLNRLKTEKAELQSA